MSIFKTIKDSDICFYVDFRDKNIVDKSGNKNFQFINNAHLNQTGVILDGVAGHIRSDDGFNIGVDDFSLMAGLETYEGNINAVLVDASWSTGLVWKIYEASTQFELFLNQQKFDFSYGSTNIKGEKSFAVSAVRNGNAKSFVNGILNNTVDISFQSSANLTASQINIGGESTQNFLKGTGHYVLCVKKALTETEIAQLTAELEAIKYPKKIIGRIYDKTTETFPIHFKTDWGSLANNRTLTTGFIENTPFEIQSGSFRIISDVINGQQIKAIECVSGGSFRLQDGYGGTEWELLIDTGSGYAESDGSGIITNNIFTMATGNKISLANIKGEYSIVKR